MAARPLLRKARQVLVSVLFAMLAAILYAAASWAALLALKEGSNLDRFLAGVTIVAVMALFYRPLWNIAQLITGLFIPASRFDPNRIVQEYSLSLSSSLEPEMLATVAIGLISEALEIRRGFLFIAYREKMENQDVYRLEGARGMGDTSPAHGILSADSPLVGRFSQSREILTQHELGSSPEFWALSQEEKNWLSSLQVDIYIPVQARDEWVGLIALGPKSSRAPFLDEDLALVRMLADQTAVALQNARLIESLKRVNNDFRRAYSALEQSNRQLGRTHAQLEKIDRTKSDFISVASHELRTPLTVIRGYSEMLMEDPTIRSEAYRSKLVDGIHNGIMRLHEIVESMLDIASIDTRSLSLNIVSISPSVLIQSIISGLQREAAERQLVLQLENLEALPNIEGDPEALRKVFYHLIVNAIKYTPNGGKVMFFGYASARGRRNFAEDGVEIIVSDTGIGIAPEYHELIFTKFYQTGELALHSTGRTKFKGAGPGLGLSIAKGIVEAHGGIIWVESPGYNEERCPGSQFHVVLPLKQPRQF